jgi:hypothetical protein
MQVNGVNLCRATQAGETRSVLRKYLTTILCCQEFPPDSNVQITSHPFSFLFTF